MEDRAGYGNFVDDELKQYLREASEQVAISDDEDKAILLENVLEELTGKEMKVATDAECSRMLEVLITSCSDTSALGVLERLAQRETLFTVASSPFGSHVLDKLLARLATALGAGVDSAEQVLEEVVFLVKEDLQDYIENKYATHLARRLLQLLIGDLDEANARGGGARSAAAADASGLKAKLAAIDARASGAPAAAASGSADERPLLSHVRTFAHVLCGAQFSDEAVMTLQRSTFAGPFLQLLLRAASFDGEVSQRLFLRMLGLSQEENEAPRAAMQRLDVKKLVAQMKNKASSHMVEALVGACPPDLFEPLWAKLKPTFAALCLNPVANFVAQGVIAAAPDARFVSEMFYAVRDNLTDVILQQRSGVAVMLLAACAGFNVCTAEVCAAVKDAFGDKAVEELVTLDMSTDLAAVAALRAPKARLSTPGCIMLRYILAMPQTACRGFTDALLALPSDQLAGIARDGGGALAVEALLKGSAPRAVKSQLLKKLKDHLGSMATLPAASRLVEALFVWGDAAEKRLVMEQIAASHKDLQGSKYGQGLYQITHLEAWLRSPEEWDRRMQSSERMSAAFQKLFGDSGGHGRKKRKRSDKAGRDSAAELAPPQHAAACTPLDGDEGPLHRGDLADADAAPRHGGDRRSEPDALGREAASGRGGTLSHVGGVVVQHDQSGRRDKKRAKRAAGESAADGGDGEADGRLPESLTAGGGAPRLEGTAPVAAAKRAKADKAASHRGDASPGEGVDATNEGSKGAKKDKKNKKTKRGEGGRQGGKSPEELELQQAKALERLRVKKERKAASRETARKRAEGAAEGGGEGGAAMTKKQQRQMSAKAKRDIKTGRVPKTKKEGALPPHKLKAKKQKTAV